MPRVAATDASTASVLGGGLEALTTASE